MAEVTFLHTSDWQLGMTRWFLAGENNASQHLFDAARRGAIKNMGEVAREVDAKFMVVAGDAFDSNTVPAHEVDRVLSDLRSLKLPIVILPGNHDCYHANSIYLKEPLLSAVERSDWLHVLSPDNPAVEIPVEVGGREVSVEVTGMALNSNDPQRIDFEDFVGALEPRREPRVLVAHGQVVSFSSQAESSLSLPAMDRAIDQGLVNYVAVGDTHSTRQLDSRGYVWFSGAQEVTEFDHREPDSGNVLAVTIPVDDTGVEASALASGPRGVPKVAKHRVGSWRWLYQEHDFADYAEIEQWLSELEELDQPDATCVKYRISGTVSLAEKSAVDAALHRLEPVFAALYAGSDSGLTVVSNPEDIEALGLTGFMRDAAEELQEQLTPQEASSGGGAGGVRAGADRQTTADALSLLMRLAQR